MFFYVYYSYEQFGRGYIGFRQSKVLPEEDVAYFGSFSDKSFRPTEKIILAQYDTNKQALEAEISLHSFFDVAVNPHFANRACQLSSGFTTSGTTLSEKTRQKIREAVRKRKDRCRTFGMLGKKHSEETKKKMSETTKLQFYSEETKKKMSESAKKRFPTEAEKQKISETLKKRPKLPCKICGKMITDYRMSIHMKIHKEEV